MKRFLTTALIGAVIMAASAMAQIRPPQLGFAGAADGTLRPVYGVAGNFILGPPVLGRAGAGQVISQAFSGSLGLLKTESTLVAFDGRGQVLATMDAAAGPALFAFSLDGATALAYVASSNMLLEWSAGRFEAIPFRPEPDNVVAVSLSNTLEASLIVQREGEIWDVASASQRALVGVTAPVLVLASGELIYSDANGIVLRKLDNSEVHVAGRLPAQFTLQQMGTDWVQLSDSASEGRFAVRILSGREGFYRLPGVGR
jgi:hypothetical protein